MVAVQTGVGKRTQAQPEGQQRHRGEPAARRAVVARPCRPPVGDPLQLPLQQLLMLHLHIGVLLFVQFFVDVIFFNSPQT